MNFCPFCEYEISLLYKTPCSNYPPQVFCSFCITVRLPSQPKHVLVNTDSFSCKGFTGTYNGPRPHTVLEKLMQAASVLS